jgi:hypothetical protein
MCISSRKASARSCASPAGLVRGEMVSPLTPFPPPMRTEQKPAIADIDYQ